MESYPLRTVRQPAANVNVSRCLGHGWSLPASGCSGGCATDPPAIHGRYRGRTQDTPSSVRPRAPPPRGQSQANFTANMAAITKTPAEHSLPRPASTLLAT